MKDERRILIVGGGGREHAIAWALAQSERVGKIIVAPGNGGTDNVEIQGTTIRNAAVGVGDFDGLIHLATEAAVVARLNRLDELASECATKVAEAEKLISVGAEIQIISETRFLEMAGENGS